MKHSIITKKIIIKNDGTSMLELALLFVKLFSEHLMLWDSEV